MTQTFGEPRGAAGTDALEDPAAFCGQTDADPAAVLGRAHALDQAGALQPVEMAGEGGCGDPLLRGQLSQAEAGALANQPQQSDLPARDAERIGLPPELAREAEQHRPQAVRQCRGIGGNVANHLTSQPKTTAPGPD